MKKVILITGISKGLGASLATIFSKHGAIVVGCSRTPPPFEIDLFLQGDITDPLFQQNLINQTLLTYGRVDVLINNAGIGVYTSWIDMSIEELRDAFELNFFAPVVLSRLALPHLEKTQGSIINLSSVAGKLPLPYMGGYNATKFALNAFSDSFRAEVEPLGIHVLNLIVGRVSTGFATRALGGKKTPSTPGVTTPQEFAHVAYKAYLQKKREVTFPQWYKIPIFLYRIFPQFFDSLARKKWDR